MALYMTVVLILGRLDGLDTCIEDFSGGKVRISFFKEQGKYMLFVRALLNFVPIFIGVCLAFDIVILTQIKRSF